MRRLGSTVVILLAMMLSAFACSASEIKVTRVVELEVTREIEVPVEVIREVEVTREIEVIREVEVEVADEVEPPIKVEVTREIEVPVEVIREVEVTREIEVNREVEVEVADEVEPPIKVEVTREIEVPVEIEVTREIKVEVTREVEVIREIEVEVTREVEMIVTATPVPAPVVTNGRSRTNPLPMGSIIGDTLTELRLLAIEHPWNDYEEVNKYNDAPAESFEYLWMRFEVAFFGHADTTLDWTDVSMRVVGSEGTVYKPAYVVVENDRLGQEVFGGGSFVFDEVFEVSTTDSDFVLIYESSPDYLTNANAQILKEHPCWDNRDCFPPIYAIVDVQSSSQIADGEKTSASDTQGNAVSDDTQASLSSDPYERGKAIADFWWRNVWEAYPDIIFTPEEPRQLEPARDWAGQLTLQYFDGSQFEPYQVWVGKSSGRWYQREFLPRLVDQLNSHYFFTASEEFQHAKAQEFILNDVHVMFSIFKEYTEGDESYAWTSSGLGNMIWVYTIGWIEHDPTSPNCEDMKDTVGDSFGDNSVNVCRQGSLFVVDGKNGDLEFVLGDAAYTVNENHTKFIPDGGPGYPYRDDYVYE